MMSADYVHEQGDHGYRAYPYTSYTDILTPLIPASDESDQKSIVPTLTSSTPTTAPVTTD